MKKFLFSVAALAVIFSAAGAMFNARAANDCPNGQRWNEETQACEAIPASTPLWIIIEGICKPGMVEYSDWSACDKRFGKNGFQWRNIKYPTANGCRPSTMDQVNTVRDCLK